MKTRYKNRFESSGLMSKLLFSHTKQPIQSTYIKIKMRLHYSTMRELLVFF